MTEPTTEAGRRLLVRLTTRDTQHNEPYEAAILAIEQEARDERPPVGYWCCAFDWDEGTFRTTHECIRRTENPTPTWARIDATLDRAAASIAEIQQDARADLAASIEARVAALPTWDKRSVPGGLHVNRAAVLAVVREEATRG